MLSKVVQGSIKNKEDFIGILLVGVNLEGFAVKRRIAIAGVFVKCRPCSSVGM